MTTEETRSERFAMRLTPSEIGILERAAAVGGEDVSTFVRRLAITGAKAILLAAKERHRGG